jgi:hypothetical protein
MHASPHKHTHRHAHLRVHTHTQRQMLVSHSAINHNRSVHSNGMMQTQPHSKKSLSPIWPRREHWTGILYKGHRTSVLNSRNWGWQLRLNRNIRQDVGMWLKLLQMIPELFIPSNIPDWLELLRPQIESPLKSCNWIYVLFQCHQPRSLYVCDVPLWNCSVRTDWFTL